MATVAGGTLLSEDGAAIFAGVLIADGQLATVPAMLAVFIGIWLGDLGLYGIGRACGLWPNGGPGPGANCTTPAWVRPRHGSTAVAGKQSRSPD